MINALDYGFKTGQASIDNTAMLNKFIADTSLSECTLYFPKGEYWFHSLSNKIDRYINVVGEGINKTTFVRNYPSSTLMSGLLHATKTVNIKDIAFWAKNQSHGGCCVLLEGLDASASVLENLYITSPDKTQWGIPICLTSTAPLGIRGCAIKNCYVFAANTHLAWFVNVQGLFLQLNAYPAGGTVNQVVIQHTGSYSSNNISIDTTYMERLYLYNTNNVNLRHTNTQVAQSGCSNIKVF